jgi:hypothetical protein
VGTLRRGDNLCYFSAFWGEFIGCTPLNGVGLGPNRRGGFLRTTSGGEVFRVRATPGERGLLYAEGISACYVGAPEWAN